MQDLRQFRPEVAIEVEAHDLLGPRQVAGKRERRIPARADLEETRTGDGAPGIAQVAGHDRPILDLAGEFAREIAQAAEPALQAVVQRGAGGQSRRASSARFP